MKVIEKGHIYELQSYEGMGDQKLKFISKNGSTIVHDGTTNEEVLDVLIDRINFLQETLPCKENEFVIKNLQQSLIWLNNRTIKRLEQGVEGTKEMHKS